MKEDSITFKAYSAAKYLYVLCILITAPIHYLYFLTTVYAFWDGAAFLFVYHMLFFMTVLLSLIQTKKGDVSYAQCLLSILAIDLAISVAEVFLWLFQDQLPPSAFGDYHASSASSIFFSNIFFMCVDTVMIGVTTTRIRSEKTRRKMGEKSANLKMLKMDKVLIGVLSLVMGVGAGSIFFPSVELPFSLFINNALLRSIRDTEMFLLSAHILIVCAITLVACQHLRKNNVSPLKLLLGIYAVDLFLYLRHLHISATDLGYKKAQLSVLYEPSVLCLITDGCVITLLVLRLLRHYKDKTTQRIQNIQS